MNEPRYHKKKFKRSNSSSGISNPFELPRVLNLDVMLTRSKTRFVDVQVEQARKEWNAQKNLEGGWLEVKSKRSLKGEKKSKRRNNKKRESKSKEERKDEEERQKEPQQSLFHYDSDFPEMKEAHLPKMKKLLSDVLSKAIASFCTIE